MSNKKKTNLGLELKDIKPLTPNQEKVFNYFHESYHLLLHGYAGTGKTYISLYLSLKELLTGKVKRDKITIIRSVVQSRDMGFLPGSVSEKSLMYETPYEMICSDLFGRGDAYSILKQKGIVDFTTTSFLRGMTFDNAIILVDEIQNMSFQELDTIITRTGDNSRVIFCGDYRQTDLTNDQEKKGLGFFLDIIKDIKDIRCVDFDKQDIVRSGLVKEYILKKFERQNG
jgi:phosphate starvation-inducible protein PhoH